jgi:hypothetical protein
VVYAIVCGAGRASAVGRLIEQAHERGWDVHVIATPAALDFLDLNALEGQTGHPVRSEYAKPGSGRVPLAAARRRDRRRPCDLQHDQQVGAWHQ